MSDIVHTCLWSNAKWLLGGPAKGQPSKTLPPPWFLSVLGPFGSKIDVLC